MSGYRCHLAGGSRSPSPEDVKACLDECQASRDSLEERLKQFPNEPERSLVLYEIEDLGDVADLDRQWLDRCSGWETERRFLARLVSWARNLRY